MEYIYIFCNKIKICGFSIYITLQIFKWSKNHLSKSTLNPDHIWLPYGQMNW